MQVVDLPIKSIMAPDWNPNEMDQAMRTRLRNSIRRFGLQLPLVVRPTGNGDYETIGGAQRLSVLMDIGFATVPCVVVGADDAEARLLSQALNHIAGQDNPGLRAEIVRHLLEALPQEQLLAILPDSAESLQSLASLGQETIAQHLAAWQKAQGARLRHLQFQLTDSQLEMVEQALQHAMARSTDGNASPNRRGSSLAAICRAYIRAQEDSP